MGKQQSVRKRILGELESLETVDCHSHTMLRRNYYRAEGGYDLFGLMSYFTRDIQATAGENIYEGTTTDEERWRRLKPVLEKTRNVSYWRHNIVTYQKVFGFRADDVTDGNWKRLNDTIRRKTQDPAWFDHVVRKVCRLKTQVRNIPWFEDWEPEYFTPVLRMEGALRLLHPVEREKLAKQSGLELANLKRVKEALAQVTEDYKRRGAVGIKLAHAYWRTLACDPVSERKAASVYQKAVGKGKFTEEEEKAFQDHIIYWLASLCAEMGLVFQIHTGVQSTWGHVPYSDPLHLLPLLRAYKSVRFDLFHAGYPYSREMGMLGKHYPNVWLNMAWMYVITMEGSRQTLREWFDLVPAYRLLGFGSDVAPPEFIYGHLVMARSCVADVLAEKVARDFLSLDAALDLARKLFHDNPVALYGLK
jgi:predicted TIM-barrel fold metal-dependent hydrolase